MNLHLRLILVLASFGLLSTSACAQQRVRRIGGNGGEIIVRAGDDLQAALDSARPGDTIAIQAGAVFAGPFTLRAKTGDQFITIRTQAFQSLPKEGVRISPGDAPLMPKIIAPGDGKAAIQTESGAHHYRFFGIEFKTRDAKAFTYSLLSLGSDSARSAPEQPHHLIFDRCFIHADGPSRRGIALNSGETEISDSYISGFKEQGKDSQAICGWNGPGPYRIVNNYLEAAGENILFGGSDPSIPNLVPSDIEIRRNHLTKPLSWRGAQWVVKNLLELKNARRVTVEGNVLENNWAADQGGTAVLFTPRNQDGHAPWSVVSDVTFRNNIIRHAVNGIAVMASDYTHPSRLTHAIHIRNNLFYDIDGGTWGKGNGGVLLTFSGAGASDIELSHNTAVHTGACVSFEDGSSVTGLVLANNIMRFHIIGSGVAGTEALNRFANGKVVVTNNAIVLSEKRDYWVSRYPESNFYPETYLSAGFSNASAGDYSLQSASSLKRRATDKADLGANFEELKAAGAFQDAALGR
jgi:hypothetical protein